MPLRVFLRSGGHASCVPVFLICRGDGVRARLCLDVWEVGGNAPGVVPVGTL